MDMLLTAKDGHRFTAWITGPEDAACGVVVLPEIFGINDVDGALVGGASLKAADFLPIVAAAAT